MNKFTLILFVCIYGVNAFSQDVLRETYLLNNDWETVFNNQDKPDDFYTKQGETEDWKPVNLPHNWDDYGGARQLLHGNLHGTAWYKKGFGIPAATENRHFFLRFEGVGTYATVILNGMNFGRHPGGRVSFTIDVTRAIKPGAGNKLLVKAEHPVLISDMPCVCGGCSSEWGFSEG
ncbi:MAG: hypothetical protein JXA82_17515, partial [Sedimentisphaerales bacterium]|nr:hypothetical protein [Sedimentisphaerales bacterium]